MKLHSIIVWLSVLASTAAGQSVPPALMVQQDGRSVPLGLAELRCEVRIFAAVAETTTTMTFSNPTLRPMEGDLYFPLPEGATISGYALDINGQMIDGVAVEKHEARRVFEEVERHGIDPGLVQWAKGNNFQTRVFPIPAQGTRTIRVSYVSELIGGQEAPAYRLPLKFKDKIRDFSLRVEVIKSAAPPRVTRGELANFNFEKWHESYVAETKQHDWLPVEDMVVSLPKTDQPQVLVEADGGDAYYAVQDYPAPDGKDAQPPLAAEPRRVVIIWDASGSRAGDHGREIALLRNYIQGWWDLKDNAIPAVKLDLVLFRNAASKPQRIDGSGGPAALAAVLQAVQYDGGTQLGAIGPVDGEKPDLYLLFTDGLSNFGSEEPPRFDAPLFIISADATANHPLLQSLAMSNGGQYFNLANWKDADILARIGQPSKSFLSASIALENSKDLYPQRPQPVAGRFLLVGKLTKETMTIKVRYGLPGGKPDERTFEASRKDAVKGTLLRRLWAQKKLACLMVHQKENEKEIAALGKEYGLVTPYTSLLVLDSLDQYVQYEITPPKSLPALRDEYARRIDTLDHQRQKAKADKLAEVVAMWQRRVEWWNAEFKYAKDFKWKGEQGGQGGVDSRGVPESLVPAPIAPGGAMNGQRAVRAEPASSARGEPALPHLAQPPHQAVPAVQQEAQQAETPGMPAAPRPAAASAPALPRAGQAGTLSLLQEGFASQDRLEAKHDEGRNLGTSSLGGQPGIVIKPWQPDMPYVKGLQAAKKADRFAVYMRYRAQYGISPGFYLDCADVFRESGQSELALQVLSNIAELQLEEPTLLRSPGSPPAADRRNRPGRANLRAGARFAAGGAAVLSRPGPGLGAAGRGCIARGGSGPRRLRPGYRPPDAGGDAPLGQPLPRNRGHRPGRSQPHHPAGEGGGRVGRALGSAAHQAPGLRRPHCHDLAGRQHRHRPLGHRTLRREGVLPAQPHDDRRAG